MDAVKRIRTQQRRLFTKACNEFDAEEANLNIAEKIIKLKLIEEKATLMISSEENVNQFLFSENVNDDIIEKEIDESESYIDRWRLLEIKLKQLSLSEREELFSNCTLSPQNSLLRYPKIQLPTFNGDLRNWVRFWGQFEKVDKDLNIDQHDKFAYLSQCMEKGSVADELIKSFPPGGKSYEKAIEQLKSRFGREELLIQVYVRDLLSLVLQKQNMPKKSLRNLYDLLETKLRALEILGVTRDKYAAMLFPLVESALPEETLLAWERYRSTNRRSNDERDQNTSKIIAKTDLDSILEFLQDEVQAEERIILASQNFGIETKHNFKLLRERKAGNNKNKYGDTRQIPSAADLLTSSKVQRKCIFCHNFHNSTDCLNARKMTMEDRENLVEKSGSCFLCLRPGHQVRKCYSKITCFGCGKRHNILLCRNIKQQTHLSTEKATAEINDVPKEDQALANVSKSPDVILQTLTVLIRGDGRTRKARAIIDTASQRSYVLKNTAKEMRYKRENWEYLQHSLFGGENTGVRKHDVFTLYLASCDGSYNCHFKVLSQPVICSSVPPTAPVIHLNELTGHGIHVKDDYKCPIEILIGADVAGKIITGGHKSLPCGLTAIETRLGWTIMGRIPQISSEGNGVSIANSMLSTTRTVTELWTLDTLGITDPSEKKTREELHEAAREPFTNAVQVDKEDRYVVHLPWLADHPPLPDKFNLALQRLDGTVRKLKDENLYDDYNPIFEKSAGEGIIEEVPKQEIQLPSHYLPHRHVMKENSTTKLRPTFDASSKIKGSPSLNECLERGPNLIELISSILTRFRLSEIGVSSSPFLLGAVIQPHLQIVLNLCAERQSIYPNEMIQKLLSSFYFNNCVTSVKDDPKLQTFVKEASEVMAVKQFDLRGCENRDYSKLNISWDQEVNADGRREFLKWMKDVSFLSEVEVTRSIKFLKENSKHSLYIFCDASQSTYATAVFLRVEKENSVYVQLVQARERVSPCGKRKTTIARLELLGATIAARLLSSILKDIPVKKVHCWTNSTTVLAWIRREDSWGVFVHNRVKEKLYLTSKEIWRYVPGTMNPADLPSRGCSAKHFVSLKWWEGPSWLYEPDELWPVTEDTTCEEEGNNERVKKIVQSMLTIGVNTLLNSHVTDYKKAVNVMGWIKRFIYNCRHEQKNRGDLSVSDVNEAEKAIVYLIQQESFSGLTDKRLQSLDTFLEDKIIRLKSTVLRRDDHEEFRMPAILPGEHPLVKSLVLEKHRKIGHGGVSHTLSSLREKYWLLCGRRTVKHVLRSCIVCKRYSAKPNNPPSAPPPADRVQDAAVFQVTGADFAGPVILRDNSKAWIALFTCAVYRAVHLELVTSMSTEAFLLAFHRFVTRRGKPSIMYSDNGTNFKGAASALALIDFQKIFHEAREENIVWKFIPPSAPWWGGWWERLVGMMKSILKKTLGRASLSYEEMITALCNCEAILNDRPLTTVSSDPSLTPLTPANFLREIKSNIIPDIKADPNSNKFRRRLQYVQTVREAFKKRFRQEYLGALCRNQRNKKFTPLKEGDIVLIGEDDRKRLFWPLGRIVKVLPGSDGIVRRAIVKTQSGELLRAAQRLYPLELSSLETIPETVQKGIKAKREKENLETTGKKQPNDLANRLHTKAENPVTTRSGRVIKAPEKLSL